MIPKKQRKFLNRDIDTIFIILGFSCNLNCRYCLQHPLVEKQLTTEINPDLFEFINQVVEESSPKKVNLRFFGGEPLLYFNQIKDIVNSFKSNKNISFSIITNGKAFTEEIVDFFNINNVSVTVSWDGSASDITRHFDVFSLNKELLFKLKRLNISSVLSAFTSPLMLLSDIQKLSDEYFTIHDRHLLFVLEPILDTGISDRALLDIDYDLYSREVSGLLKLFLNDKGCPGKNLPPIFYSFIHQLVGFVNHFHLQNGGILSRNYCTCGNGYETLNVDLQGNLYHCHNSSEIAGTIYDSYFKYINNIIKNDLFIHHKKECENCIAVSACYGGCKLIPFDIKQNTLCRLKKALVTPIILGLEEYGREVLNGS